MTTTIILEKNNKHFSKFMNLLMKEPEINIKDIKKTISHSSYYDIVIKKIFHINKILQEIHPLLYLAQPHFNTQTEKVYTALKRCPLKQILHNISAP